MIKNNELKEMINLSSDILKKQNEINSLVDKMHKLYNTVSIKQVSTYYSYTRRTNKSIQIGKILVNKELPRCQSQGKIKLCTLSNILCNKYNIKVAQSTLYKVLQQEIIDGNVMKLSHGHYISIKKQ